MALSLVPLDQRANSGSVITIEEIDASTPGGRALRLVLAGGGLPKKGGANWGSDQPKKTTYYPGNKTKSQQVLGFMDIDSQWAGEWKRTMLNTTPCSFRDSTGVTVEVIDPLALVEAIEQFQRGGALCRVTWSVSGSRISGGNRFGAATPIDATVTRVGRPGQFQWNPDMDTDIPWTLAWAWIGREGELRSVADFRRTEDLAKATSATQSSIAALDDAIAGKVAGVVKKATNPKALTLGQLESLASQPQAILERAQAKLRYNAGQFARAASVAKKLANAPLALKATALDFARNTVAVANQATKELERIPVEYKTKDPRVSDIARAARYFGTSQDALHSCSTSGAELEQRTRTAVVAGANRGEIGVRAGSSTKAGDLIDIVVTHEGDTPEKVSIRFYDTPDRADLLLTANRLPAHTPAFRPGTILVIPALSNAGA